MPRHPEVAETTASLSSSVFSELARRARKRGEPVHPLHVGDTYRLPPKEARLPAVGALGREDLYRYAPVHGVPELLDAVSSRLEARSGHRQAREDIQIMSGATAGLSVVAQSLLNPGDEVLLPSPYWPLIRGIIAVRGAKPIEVPTFTSLQDPDFDIERTFANAITDRTVALYLNSPNNPTGAVLTKAQVDALAKLAARHDLWVICDEAYEELWFTEQRPEPIWNHEVLRDRAVAMHTLSKSYGLAGARVGFCHGPKAIMNTLRSVQTFTTYCAPTPMQLAGAAALQYGDPWLKEARQEYAASGKRAAETLGIAAPAGGTFLFFDATPFLRNGEDASGFLHRCLDAGVLLTPGASSGKHFESWVRLCFTSVPPDALEEALKRLAGVLEMSNG